MFVIFVVKEMYKNKIYMIHKKIEQLIPYLSDNFISYPLWEEGLYIPSISIWRYFKRHEKYLEFKKGLEDIFLPNGYIIVENEIYNNKKTYSLSIMPDWNYEDNGSYTFTNQNWSIEEIIELLISILKK
jgi:hypothetical protein